MTTDTRLQKRDRERGQLARNLVPSPSPPRPVHAPPHRPSRRSSRSSHRHCGGHPTRSRRHTDDEGATHEHSLLKTLSLFLPPPPEPTPFPNLAVVSGTSTPFGTCKPRSSIRRIERRPPLSAGEESELDDMVDDEEGCCSCSAGRAVSRCSVDSWTDGAYY